MPRNYPPKFRRKVLDLLAAGRGVTEIAEDLGIIGACIYTWRKQDRMDRWLEHTRASGARSRAGGSTPWRQNSLRNAEPSSC